MGKDGKDTILTADEPMMRSDVPNDVAKDDPFQAFDGVISYLLDSILKKHKEGRLVDDETVDLLKRLVEIRRVLNE